MGYQNISTILYAFFSIRDKTLIAKPSTTRMTKVNSPKLKVTSQQSLV